VNSQIFPEIPDFRKYFRPQIIENQYFVKNLIFINIFFCKKLDFS